MQYIFPRQFGFHNVFTSKTDPNDTIQPFKDYTLREQEISQRDFVKNFGGHPTSTSNDHKLSVPKRLRGELIMLMRRLQKRHKSCSYTMLLSHYCPIPVRRPLQTYTFKRILTTFSKLRKLLHTREGFLNPPKRQSKVRFSWAWLHLLSMCQLSVGQWLPAFYRGTYLDKQ